MVCGGPLTQEVGSMVCGGPLTQGGVFGVWLVLSTNLTINLPVKCKEREEELVIWGGWEREEECGGW